MAARPARGILARSAGRCCGGEARRDDSPTPCKIDLSDSTRYHKNMRKREKVQENKGEATKSAPEKRTAPKAKKATKGTTEKSKRRIFTMEADSFYELEKQLRSKIELTLDDAEKRGELRKEVDAAYEKGGIPAVREILNSDKFKGISVKMFLLMDSGQLHPCGLIASEKVYTLDKWYAERQEQFNEVKESIFREAKITEKEKQKKLEQLEQEEEYNDKLRELYDGALKAFHADNGVERLIEYIRKNGEKNTIIDITLGAWEGSDAVQYIEWKLKMKGRASVSFTLLPTERAGLTAGISSLYYAGLLKEVGFETANFAREAIFLLLDLMQDFRVSPGEIRKHARISLERAKFKDVLFSDAEVGRILFEQDPSKRLELYTKMRQFKLDELKDWETLK